MPDARPPGAARNVVLVLDRRGQILVSDRDGRALWRENEAELRDLVRRTITGDPGAITTLAHDGTAYQIEIQPGRAGNGSSVFLLTLRGSTSDVWSAQGLLEAEKHQALCKLVSGMVHEMRNPLASISLTAELVGMHRGLDPELRARVGEICGHVQRVDEVLQNLRRIGKDAQAALRAAPLNEMVEDAVRLERAGVVARGVRITLDLSQGLPPILADASQLRLVVSNLIRNAAEAIQGGGREEGEIKLHTMSRHGVVRLVVEDDGPGIPPDIVGRVFEPWFTTKATGTGIGLAMCAGIVKAHGGHVRVENKWPRGARFLVDFPDPQHSTPAVHPTALGLDVRDEHARSVLVVDGEEDRLEDARAAIAALGYRVQVAQDVAVALRKLRAADFDAVLISCSSTCAELAELLGRLRLAHPEIAGRLAVRLGEEPQADIADLVKRAGGRLVVGCAERGLVQALARSLAERERSATQAGAAAGS